MPWIPGDFAIFFSTGWQRRELFPLQQTSQTNLRLPNRRPTETNRHLSLSHIWGRFLKDLNSFFLLSVNKLLWILLVLPFIFTVHSFFCWLLLCRVVIHLSPELCPVFLKVSTRADNSIADWISTSQSWLPAYWFCILDCLQVNPVLWTACRSLLWLSAC